MEKAVLEQFKLLSKIPHCSFKTSKMRDYLVDICKKSGAEVFEDKAGNIVARKGVPKVCLQAHYDMVCMGNAPKIDIYEKDGFLYAQDSSLGADNGAGIAIMLVLLRKHDNLECLFTNDEEVGLLGASSLELEIKSSYLLNLDSEEEGTVYVGCAGGLEIHANMPLVYEPLSTKYDLYEVSLSGLVGGHSGIEIVKPIPNAIIELAKILRSIDVKVISFDGGERINSIPTKASAKIALAKDTLVEGLPFEYKTIYEEEPKALSNSKQVLDYICAFPQGVNGWDEDLSIPLKSSNLSLLSCNEQTLQIEVFVRAMSEDGLGALKLTHESLFSLGGFTIHYTDKNSPWVPKPSTFAKTVRDVAKHYWEDVRFGAIHAGLECGILMEKILNIKEACSIGPRIDSPHTTHECCEVASLGRIANIVDSLLKRVDDGAY